MAATIALPGKHTLLPSVKVGTDFLSSSHFRVAQENSLSQAGIKSIFKKDYVPWGLTSRPKAATPPCHAEILQKDDRFFSGKASETAHSFGEKELPALESRGDIYSILRATNFKMDRDLTKFDSFDTTHNSSYPPKYNGPRVHAKSVLEPMGSSLPQGDPEKALQPISDYRDRYRGHAGVAKPDRAASMHQVGPDTITGDGRLPQFGTTHRDTYMGSGLPRVKAFPAPRGTNIPQGDKEKQMTKMSTMQESFPKHRTTGGYDKAATTSVLQRTNFVDGDGQNAWNDYASTFRDSYRPVFGNFTIRHPSKYRNHSDLPSGDDDHWRIAERANMTTNRFYQGTVFTPRPNIVSGADIRTRSNVFFGDPETEGQVYSTTTDDTFRPKSLPLKKSGRPDFNTRSSIPVDYYPNEIHMSTTYSDFQNPKIGKMIPNAVALENLRRSHIQAPIDGERHFSTEHLDQFVPKTTPLDSYDPGRLQRSSVPLGTLKI